MGRHLLRKGISLGTFIDPFTKVQDLGVHQITIVHIRNVGMIVRLGISEIKMRPAC